MSGQPAAATTTRSAERLACRRQTCRRLACSRPEVPRRILYARAQNSMKPLRSLPCRLLMGQARSVTAFTAATCRGWYPGNRRRAPVSEGEGSDATEAQAGMVGDWGERGAGDAGRAAGAGILPAGGR